MPNRGRPIAWSWFGLPPILTVRGRPPDCQTREKALDVALARIAVGAAWCMLKSGRRKTVPGMPADKRRNLIAGLMCLKYHGYLQH